MGKVTFLSIGQDINTSVLLAITKGLLLQLPRALHLLIRKTSGAALRGTYQKSDIPAPGSPVN